MDLLTLLKVMKQKNGSDLFITAGIPPSMKINGTIMPVTKQPLSPSFVFNLVTGAMDDKQKTEFEETRECNFAIADEQAGRFRVSAFYQRNNAGMVIRKIEAEIPNFDDLRTPEQIRNLSMVKKGLILVVGGTGSGKSTTLAAMIGHRNASATGHIITIEDPIEFVHEHKKCVVTQREVGVDTQSFEAALKNTLRQAPDIILIGEIRSRETMEHAIAFAETGHLCMATLHANNANQTLDRIINFFPDERRNQLLLDLSLNLQAIIAQQLIPTVDGKGRRAAIEILLNSPLLAAMIKKGEVHEIKGLMKKSKDEGMQTFDQALLDLVAEGAILEEVALKHADSPNDLRLMIRSWRQAEGAKQADDPMAGLSLS